MMPHSQPRLPWLLAIAGIMAAGILSRVVHTGFVLFDKYLGDALYAAMVYACARLLMSPTASALSAAAAMTAIELFQLTMIPAQMLTSRNPVTRICARLLGVEFSLRDLVAYAAGIACIYLADIARRKPRL